MEPHLSQQKAIPVAAIFLFTVLVGISIASFYIRSKRTTGYIIAHDVAQLTAIFEKINTTCGIINFEYQQNPINFLNTGTFRGSEVGPMNLKYPQKWEGPYLDDNPTIQEKEYMIINTVNGYFITPGNGVTLPNGATIGTDIIFDEESDVPQLLEDGTLIFKGKALAKRVEIP